MSAISDKHDQLKKDGLDLGNPLAGEQDAGAGGRFQRFEKGNIYAHPAIGTHEVHGGILSVYLAQGGPGTNSATGHRDLGFPISDQTGDSPPISRFEWGAIFWTQGTGGCVVYGPIWEAFKTSANLGLPLTSVTPVAGGQAVYFERGVIFWNGGAGKVQRPLVGSFAPPLLGHPQIVDPTDGETRRFRNLASYHLAQADYDALVAWRPTILVDLWTARLSLSAVGAPDARLTLAPNAPQITRAAGHVEVHLDFVAPSNQPVNLKDRTLYDLRLALPNGNFYPVSPHAMYAKASWESFGLLHVTDIHINARNEGFRAKLQRLGLANAAQGYSNFEDNFRDFVRYANHLHDLGMADVAFATGDLVDYVQEDGDSVVHDNYARLRNLILGKPLDAGGTAGEELRVPFFSSLGNHDYRVASYRLKSRLVAFDFTPFEEANEINEFSDQNITESEAIALQDGKVETFTEGSLDEALKMLQWDRDGSSYHYYDKYFATARSYVVALGKHRLAMLDTKADDGVPNDDVGTFGAYLFEVSYKLGSLPPATEKLVAQSPNLIGLLPNDLGILRNAINQAGTDGLVIVGVHGPAVDLAGEYPYYMRETLHPTADPALVTDYVRRHKLDIVDWPAHTPFFAVGDGKNGLDGGVFDAGQLEFLKTCAGVGVARPVDLILCGHNHHWAEHRFRWNATASRLEFFQDFYTENPATYYSTANGASKAGLDPDARIRVIVDPQVSAPSRIDIVRSRQGAPAGAPETVHGSISTPPYADPLIATRDPKAWWLAHRPLHAQTSALGPIESRQRLGRFFKVTPIRRTEKGDVAGTPSYVETDAPPPVQGGASLRRVEEIPAPLKEPTFQGFRLIQVGGNVIQRMRYIALAELRASDFKMPWEPPLRLPPIPGRQGSSGDKDTHP